MTQIQLEVEETGEGGQRFQALLANKIPTPAVAHFEMCKRSQGGDRYHFWIAVYVALLAPHSAQHKVSKMGSEGRQQVQSFSTHMSPEKTKMCESSEGRQRLHSLVVNFRATQIEAGQASEGGKQTWLVARSKGHSCAFLQIEVGKDGRKGVILANSASDVLVSAKLR
eukprot:CAMPEP_0198208632 /NCGR_PEP_ID=MMETSP1445-20131203/11969_1 /TAXON_ID=36898 /ORGANISM="Pyramimonas sp., Strain CCMP2087" /LENGTH=167 /DNA_ID=CAMNT_0043882101 /DNA_START=778 /DNA_END=1282 /DNA_ORIENTATION=+